MDFIVGNLGLNAKIKGTQGAPATLYAKDFDGNGKIAIVPQYDGVGYFSAGLAWARTADGKIAPDSRLPPRFFPQTGSA